MPMRAYWDDPGIDPAMAPNIIFATVDELISEQQPQRERWRENASFYLDRPIQYKNDFLDLNREGETLEDSETNELSWNVTRAMTDALVAHISLHDPAPKATTTNASEQTQYQVRKREKFVMGNIQAMGMYAILRRMARLNSVLGTGFCKGYHVDGKIKGRVLRPDQVIVDNDACSPGETPPAMFHRDFVDRIKLFGMFPKKLHPLIAEAPPAPIDTRVRDLVEFVECTSLTCGGRKGRHAIVLRGAQAPLHLSNWDAPRHNIFWMKHEEPIDGFYGESLIGPVISIQKEINYILAEARNNMRHLGVAWLRGRKPDDADEKADRDLLNTDRYKYIEGDGSAGADVVLPPFINDQFLQLLQLHWAKPWELRGVNQLMAHAAMPPGLSGVALREWRDGGSRRLSEINKAYENTVVDASYVIMDVGKEIDKAGDWKVEYADKDFIESIDFKEISADATPFTWATHPASSLPHDPAGRRAELTEAMKDGLVSRETAQKLLGWNDLTKERDLESAPEEELESMFEQMLDKGQYIPPKPFQNLELGLKVGLRYLARGRRDGVNPKTLSVIERWLNTVTDKITPKPQPPPTAQLPEGLPADPAAAAQLANAAQAMGPAPGAQAGPVGLS